MVVMSRRMRAIVVITKLTRSCWNRRPRSTGRKFSIGWTHRVGTVSDAIFIAGVLSSNGLKRIKRVHKQLEKHLLPDSMIAS